MESILVLISELGFPIVACVGLGLYINGRDKAMREDVREDKERLYEEIHYNRKIISSLATDIKSDINEIKSLLIEK